MRKEVNSIEQISDRSPSMPESSLIQRFFDASLIPADTTDERLGHYQSAATDLAGRFESEPELVPLVSSVAIDPNCPATEPLFAVVETAVKEHWKTFLVNNNDKPRQICRAIMLESLEKRAEGNDLVAATIWNASANLLGNVEGGLDQKLIESFVRGMGQRCETYAASVWHSNPNSPDGRPKLELTIPAAKASKVDQASLLAGLGDASGPTRKDGTSGQVKNQYWSNQQQHWSHQFAPIATAAIAAAIDGSVAGLSPTIKGLNKNLSSAINEHADLLSRWVVDCQKRNEKSTSLLWWKEAMYSPSLKRGYRGLKPADLALLSAHDLCLILGAPIPQSVEYFLSEAILKVYPKNPKLTLNQLITAFKSSKHAGTVIDSWGEVEEGRISLSDFISISASKNIAKSSQARVGIKTSVALHLTEWAVWFLRDNVARQLVSLGKQS